MKDFAIMPGGAGYENSVDPVEEFTKLRSGSEGRHDGGHGQYLL